MHIIEVRDKPLNWIAAVFAKESEGETYLAQLKTAGFVAERKKNSISNYPVYAIETIHKNEAGEDINYFEYTSEEGYLQRIREQKQHPGDDDWKVYFTAYIFEEPYFQQPFDQGSRMGALNHVYVDNFFLKNEDSEKGLAHGYIFRLAGRWDVDGLDKLFEKYVKSGTEAEKEELAVDGYLSIFTSMDYDFACGKLTAEGIARLVPMVDKISQLLDKKLWDVYARAYIIMLEDAIANHPQLVITYFEEAEKAIFENMKADPEESQDCYSNLALIYDNVSAHHYFSKIHWQKAVAFIRESITLSPEGGDWQFYLNLLYLPYEVRKVAKVSGVEASEAEKLYQEWYQLRVDELVKFKDFVHASKVKNSGLSLKIALAFHRLRELLEWYKADTAIFPEEDYEYWLDEAQKVSGHPSTRIELIDEAHFLHNEGKRLRRIDLLRAAIVHYQRMIDQVDAPAFEVYYKASALEDIALISLEMGDRQQAEAHYDQATAFYESHPDLVKSNRSVLMHYAEYLERCYNFPGAIKKPTIEQLTDLAIITEEAGQGMYSGPGMLRIRLALLENNEEEAIFHLTRLLLMHELCIDTEVKKLKEQLQDSSFIKLQNFVEETLIFMEEVSQGYYLDPAIKWDALKKLNLQEVSRAWEERKKVIKNRERI